MKLRDGSGQRHAAHHQRAPNANRSVLGSLQPEAVGLGREGEIDLARAFELEPEGLHRGAERRKLALKTSSCRLEVDLHRFPRLLKAAPVRVKHPAASHPAASRHRFAPERK
jgi:hypothetical protein